MGLTQRQITFYSYYGFYCLRLHLHKEVVLCPRTFVPFVWTLRGIHNYKILNSHIITCINGSHLVTYKCWCMCQKPLSFGWNKWQGQADLRLSFHKLARSWTPRRAGRSHYRGKPQWEKQALKTRIYPTQSAKIETCFYYRNHAIKLMFWIKPYRGWTSAVSLFSQIFYLFYFFVLTNVFYGVSHHWRWDYTGCSASPYAIRQGQNASPAIKEEPLYSYNNSKFVTLCWRQSLPGHRRHPPSHQCMHFPH